MLLKLVGQIRISPVIFYQLHTLYTPIQMEIKDDYLTVIPNVYFIYSAKPSIYPRKILDFGMKLKPYSDVGMSVLTNIVSIPFILKMEKSYLQLQYGGSELSRSLR